MIKTRKLDCGITLVSEKDPELQAACVGIWVGAGSAYEDPSINGISHFIEHMFFKGTTNRTYKEIALDMDNLGAQYNAFTGKEYTCFHAKGISEEFPKVCDILFDMIKNSLFDEKEMKKERGVILEEMRMGEDTPDEYALDLLSEAAFDGTDLSQSVIGTRKALKSIGRSDIINYINKEYTKDHMVVSVVGNYNEKILIDQINSYFGDFKKNKKKRDSGKLSGKQSFISKAKDITQSHLVLGIPTVSLASDDYYVQAIVNEVLGGSMSSMLFQNIREERGLAYSVFSAPMAHTDHGILFIYAGVSLGKEAAAIEGIAEELEKLGKEGLTKDQLEIIKQRLKASYIFSQERLESRMIRMGRSTLLLGNVMSQKEIIKELDKIKLDRVNAFCRQISDIADYSASCVSRNKVDLKKIIKG